MTPEDLSREHVVASGLQDFDLQAYVGTTKHMGELAATRELAELCHVDAETCVLDLGRGVGPTTFYLARTYGAPVVGVDVHEAIPLASASHGRP